MSSPERSPTERGEEPEPLSEAEAEAAEGLCSAIEIYDAEREDAASAADLALETPNADPDDDLRMISRQFNRARDREFKARDAIRRLLAERRRLREENGRLRAGLDRQLATAQEENERLRETVGELVGANVVEARAALESSAIEMARLLWQVSWCGGGILVRGGGADGWWERVVALFTEPHVRALLGRSEESDG